MHSLLLNTPTTYNTYYLCRRCTCTLRSRDTVCIPYPTTYTNLLAPILHLYRLELGDVTITHFAVYFSCFNCHPYSRHPLYDQTLTNFISFNCHVCKAKNNADLSSHKGGYVVKLYITTYFTPCFLLLFGQFL